MAFGFIANAQLSKGSYATVVTSKDTAVNADTISIVIGDMPSHLKAFQFTVTKVSGTVGSKVYLDATINGTNWIRLDSMTNTDQAYNTKIFTVTSTMYNSYRAYYPTTGTQKSTLQLAFIRRQDE